MTITSIIMKVPLPRKGINYIITAKFCGMNEKKKLWYHKQTNLLG